METGFIAARDGTTLHVRVRGEKQRPAWLLCGPGLEEEIFARPLLQATAAELTARGRGVVAYDYTGNGHSDGSVVDADLARWARDGVDVWRATHGELAPEAIIGMRLGGEVALIAAHELRPAHVVLCEPVVNGERWLTDALRHNMTTQLSVFKKVVQTREQMLARLRQDGTPVNVLGFELGLAFVDSVLSIGTAAPPPSPVAVIAFQSSAAKINQEVRDYAQRLGATLTTVPGRSFWSENRQFEPYRPELTNAILRAGGIE